jgi:hypothetical protein
MPLVVRPDGQRAEREDGVLADVPRVPSTWPMTSPAGVAATRDNAGSHAGPARSSSISLASGGIWPGGRRGANAAVVMARMTSASRAVSRRISTRSR